MRNFLSKAPHGNSATETTEDFLYDTIVEFMLELQYDVSIFRNGVLEIGTVRGHFFKRRVIRGCKKLRFVDKIFTFLNRISDKSFTGNLSKD